jgi:hypothetical protein
MAPAVAILLVAVDLADELGGGGGTLVVDGGGGGGGDVGLLLSEKEGEDG